MGVVVFVSVSPWVGQELWVLRVKDDSSADEKLGRPTPGPNVSPAAGMYVGPTKSFGGGGGMDMV
jgi:hypothetical protein